MRGQEQDPADGRVSRIQTLLVSVRDIASSLHRLSAQLEREVGPALATSVGAGGAQADDGDGSALAALRQENAQLRGSLDARAVIEQAKGMLMARHECSAERAFELLVGLSQSEQRKVRDIAADMVTGVLGQDPEPLLPMPGSLGSWPAPPAGRAVDAAASGSDQPTRGPVRIDLAAIGERTGSTRRRTSST